MTPGLRGCGDRRLPPPETCNFATSALPVLLKERAVMCPV
jgi:hypothetical protein